MCNVYLPWYIVLTGAFSYDKIDYKLNSLVLHLRVETKKKEKCDF
jgi:hypothetical protein